MAPVKLCELGRVEATQLGALASVSLEIAALLGRHVTGDWGEDVDDEDWDANDEAVGGGTRILSGYRVDGERIWIITEADRSSTCVLKPEEY